MARALGLGPRGREFESRIPEVKKPKRMKNNMYFDLVDSQNIYICVTVDIVSIYPLRVLAALVNVVNTMILLRVNYVRRIGFGKNDSIFV